ncbi:helix-turn-helix domain-containing protein [Clostridiales Family XIII bacterium ASD5510]|uniref:Helix-turn-helix domain-containing protein n=2 Tax=Bacteria TaxID=2 RepID=A0A9J6QZ70_9FIRM|nr:helix-turn-helix domain-containing protein [Hominibacterium faecale]MCU7380822.1 helix-turn-helix domain-containing protein [Hominibacterium faecale]
MSELIVPQAMFDAFIDAIADRVADKLAERHAQMQPEPLPDNTTFTVEEAAEHIGVSKETIYKLVRSGEVPAFKVGRSGGKWHIYKRELDKWIADGGSA